MGDAIREFVERANLRIEPVEKLCKLLEEFQTSVRRPVVDLCSLALGCRMDIGESAVDAADPVVELSRPADIADIRKKLIQLTAVHHVLPNMLLLGLFIYVKNGLAYLASHAASNAAIDQDLAWLDKLRDYKRLSPKERPGLFEKDEFIDRAIQHVRDQATKRTGEQENARAALEQIEDAWNKQFPETYWLDWLHRMAEES